MARVLYLTQVLPYPLTTGARVRQYYVLRQLARHHQVDLVSFVRPDDRAEHVAHLQGVCASVQTVPMRRSRLRDVRAVLTGALTGLPIVIARDQIGAMRSLVQRTLASGAYDIVHADQVSMAQYGLLGNGVRRVLDLHNAMCVAVARMAKLEPDPLRRMVARREAGALARYEASLCRRYDRVVFVTDQDRQAIERHIPDLAALAPARRFATIPICADPQERQPVVPAAHPHRVTALGAMFWPPNAEGVVWFAREVWPSVRASFPQARFTVVGIHPPPALAALDGQAGVEVAGYVDDLRQLLSETAALIVPLRAAGGMRVKILDAWCWGLPIVSTSIGAEGMAVRDGENILIADSARAFADAVARVLSDRDLADCLRRNGRRWVEANYDWRQVYAAWDQVYGRMLS